MMLLSRGYTQRSIASEMHLSIGKINNVVQILRSRARARLNEYCYRTLPEEMELALVRLDNIIRELHRDLGNNKDMSSISKRDRYNAMQLINQCTQLKLDILGAGVLANQLNQQGQGQQLGQLPVTEAQSQQSQREQELASSSYQKKRNTSK